MPSRPTAISDVLAERAAKRGARRIYTFLKMSDEGFVESPITYAGLDARARAVAALLVREKLRGNRVLLLYPAGLDFVAAAYGCLYAGVTMVPQQLPAGPNGLREASARLRAVAADCSAAAVLTTTAIAADAASLPVRALPTDALESGSERDFDGAALKVDFPALLQYTSGSTREPRGARLNHETLLANAAHIQRSFAMTEHDSSVFWLPHYHDMGLIGGILQPLYSDVPTYLMSPLDFLQHPVHWLRAMSRFKATISGGPGFAFELCARRVSPAQRAELDLSQWRLAIVGAEPIRMKAMRAFLDAFSGSGFRSSALFPGYGLAEASLMVSGGPLDAGMREVEVEGRAYVSCGPVVGQGDQSIRIVDPETRVELAAGEVGEIWVSGPNVAAGYWAREAESRDIFEARLEPGGEGPFLRTGDLGTLLIDGELVVVGRLKDVIIIGGRNIHAGDLELGAEGSHCGLRPSSIAAFAVETGEGEQLVIVAEVDARFARASLPASGPDVANALRDAVVASEGIAPHKIVLVRAGGLARTTSGKIRRFQCRKDFLGGTLNVAWSE